MSTTSSSLFHSVHLTAPKKDWSICLDLIVDLASFYVIFFFWHLWAISGELRGLEGSAQLF